MTKIKLCGLSKQSDIETANFLKPEFIGFVFAKKSKRYISPNSAKELKNKLINSILAVGVFVNEPLENIAKLLNNNIINIAQLHGNEDNNYINALKSVTNKPVIKAFGINSKSDIILANKSVADYILLDSLGGGTGKTFEYSLLKDITRPYFLAGGLTPQNVAGAIKLLNPYAVDVSSGIESGGQKDKLKMQEFVKAVRGINF